MEKKYVVYYRFTTTHSLPDNDAKVANVKNYCKDGLIVQEYTETRLGKARIETFQEAINTAKAQRATLVIAEMNQLETHFSSFNFS